VSSHVWPISVEAAREPGQRHDGDAKGGDHLWCGETDQGLFVGSLVAAGYEVYAVNPMSVARYLM
jgi:hypothetical protein